MMLRTHLHAVILIWSAMILGVFAVGVSSYIDCSPQLAKWTQCRKVNGTHSDPDDPFPDVLDPMNPVS